MKQQNFGLVTKVGIIILIFSFILLPISPSISMAEEDRADLENRLAALTNDGQDEDDDDNIAAAAGRDASAGAAAEGITKKKLLIGGLIAAAAVGAALALDDDDDEPAQGPVEHP
jgi:hypothetical protein